jgi:hypothetical protein
LLCGLRLLALGHEVAGNVNIRELSEYLGHADPGFTLRIYAHLLPDSQPGSEGHRRPHVPAARRLGWNRAK